MPTRKSAASGPTPRRSPSKSTASRRASTGRGTATRRSSSQRNQPLFQWPDFLNPNGRNRPVIPGIPYERRLDLLGMILALLGLLTFLSLLSNPEGSITGWWITFLGRGVGWGMFVLPLAFLGTGLWLIMRNIERLPQVAVARLAGVVMLYLDLLAFLHFFGGGGLQLAKAGQGGGYLGGLILLALETTLGEAGSLIVLIAWLIVSLALTLDLSIPDLFRWLPPIVARLRTGIEKMLAEWRMNPASPPLEPEPPTSEELPAEFTPLHRSSAEEGAAESSGITSNAPGSPEGTAATKTRQTPWVTPEIETILEPGTTPIEDDAHEQQRAQIIEETLASFGAPGHIVEIHRGPTITQFGVEPDFIENRNGRTRVRVSKIVALADDLALALAAQRIRIQAPVPGRAYVGIEVPNSEISRVALREVIESESFQKSRSPLRFALGKDVAGRPISVDLAAMPHLLIAGTTGSGKSVCVNAILSCLLINNTPDDVRLILVDPKRVELTGYNGIPHLLAPVVVDAERVVGALQWMMREMDNRYHKFAQIGARNIVDYNTRLQARGEKKIPYLVVVIDELADLMMLAPDETERTITRLAQLARATGLHLILATQRPSVDVLTGLIKANFPARIAFAVASGVDSRVILDQPGAERLLGRGDMLFQAPDAPAPVRLQGVFVSDSEIQRLVTYWRSLTTPEAPEQASENQAVTLPPESLLKQTPLFEDVDLTPQKDEDPLLKEATELVRREGRASISMLQRRMRIGYSRAARLIDTLEETGIIGPSQPNSQVRQVLDYGQTIPPAEE